MAKPNNVNMAPGGGGGRGVRSASGKGKVKPTLKGKLAEPSKASVKVKPPAKTKPAPLRLEKNVEQEWSSINRSWNPFEGGLADGPMAIGKSRAGRILRATNQSGSGKASAPIAPKGSWNQKPIVRINSNPVRANRTRSGKKAK